MEARYSFTGAKALYFYNEGVAGFGNADGEAYLSYWTQETPQLVSDMKPPWGLEDLTAYPSTPTERCWFLRPEATHPMPAGPATLGLVFAYADEHYPLRANASFAWAKADFEKSEWRRQVRLRLHTSLKLARRVTLRRLERSQ